MKPGVTASQPLRLPTAAATFTQTGLLYWLAADHGAYSDDAGTTLATDQQTVARWANRGSKPDVVQPDATKRLTLSDDAFTFSGATLRRLYNFSANAIHFDDLDFAQPAGTDQFNPYSMFVVTYDAGAAADQSSIIGSPFANGKTNIHFASAPAFRFVSGSVDALYRAQQYLTYRAQINAALTAPRLAIRQNAVTLVDAEFAWGATDAVLSTQFLRNTSLANGGYWKGEIYEYLLYDRWLTDTEVGEVESYLASKYAI